MKKREQEHKIKVIRLLSDIGFAISYEDLVMIMEYMNRELLKFTAVPKDIFEIDRKVTATHLVGDMCS